MNGRAAFIGAMITKCGCNPTGPYVELIERGSAEKIDIPLYELEMWREGDEVVAVSGRICGSDGNPVEYKWKIPRD